MMTTTTNTHVPQGQVSLKKKKSLRQLLIPSRQKSTRISSRKQSSTVPIIASDDSGPVIAIAYHHVTTASPPTDSVEPVSASSSCAPSSLLSEGSSRRPSSTSRPSTSNQPEALNGPELPTEGFSITQRRPLGRKRASTLTNFSKPYGALQESSLTSQPTRKTSHQTLRQECGKSPQFQRSFTDSAGIPAKQHVRGPSATLVGASASTSTAHGVSGDLRPEQIYPWMTAEDSRKSTRSDGSSNSSLQDSKHGSTFTKISSSTETTVDTEYTDDGKDHFTVNDVIDMYAELEDDECQEHHDDTSAKIAEAMNAPIGSLPTPGRSPRTPSTPLMSRRRIRNLLHQPPALQRPTKTHDTYGFRKFSRDVTIEAYDRWYETYAQVQTRRNSKWQEFLQDEGIPTARPIRFPLPSTKVQRYIRKGIPPAWRGDAWFYYAGGSHYLNTCADHYVDLVARAQTEALSRNDKDAIERDLHRTFPDNLHFKAEASATSTQIIETPIMTALRRVLSAFAIDHPKTGYCQSLNFIAGLLLLFLPEEKAYWMLHIVTTNLLPGTHELSLEGANVDLWVLMLALKQANPILWAKVGGGEAGPNSNGIPPISLCTTSWFMSAFIGTLPVEPVLRVWDVLFYEGSKTLFRVALAIFKSAELQIKSVQDSMENFQIVQTLPRKMVDVGQLFDLAFSRGEVGKRWIEKKRAERRDFYAKERAVEKARRISREAAPRRPSEDMQSPMTPDIISPESALPAGKMFQARTWETGSRPTRMDL